MPPLAKNDTMRAPSAAKSRYVPRALVADLGGTNMRFALSDLDELTISNYALFKNDLFSSPIEALAAYLKTTPERPDHVGIAVAGQVYGDEARMTNRPWSITARDVRQLCGAGNVHFVNDFEAIALALPALGREELVQIGGDTPVPGTTLAVLGPGTGLGVAGLARTEQGDIALAGEGGHVAFAPRTSEDFEIMDALRNDLNFVSAEKLISGPGLVTLYQLLSTRSGRAIAPMTPQAVVDRARDTDDALAVKALSLFVTWLGRFAGDVALTFGARSGVYIGGGIAPRILPELKAGPFREAFEDKGRLTAYLAAIPINIIATPNAGLKGAARAVSLQLGHLHAGTLQ